MELTRTLAIQTDPIDHLCPRLQNGKGAERGELETRISQLQQENLSENSPHPSTCNPCWVVKALLPISREELCKLYDDLNVELLQNPSSIESYRSHLISLSQIASHHDLSEESQYLLEEAKHLHRLNDFQSIFTWVCEYQRPENTRIWLNWAYKSFPNDSFVYKIIADTYRIQFKMGIATSEKAIKWYFDAIRLSIPANDEIMMKCLESVAEIFAFNGHYERASQYYFHASICATDPQTKVKLYLAEKQYRALFLEKNLQRIHMKRMRQLEVSLDLSSVFSQLETVPSSVLPEALTQQWNLML